MAGATEAGEEEAFDVATWRVITLFLFILIIDSAVEFIDEFVTHRLSAGLSHAWAQLKFETMALGVVSLLLVVFEDDLLKICINSPDKDKGSPSYDDASPYAPAGADPEYHADDSAHRRRLLAGGGGNPCKEGKEPLWESDLIHKAHILIFLIAASHLVYAMISITLSMIAVRRWHKFEEVVSDGKLLPLPVGGLQREGEPKLWFGLRQCFRQVTHPVDVASYGAMRALFLHHLEVHREFNYANLVNDYLTEEFARVVRFDVWMWVIAIAWVSFPEGSYGGFALTGLFILASIIAGAKLHVVASRLAQHAYSRFYVDIGSKGEAAGASGGVRSTGKGPKPLAEATEHDSLDKIEYEDAQARPITEAMEEAGNDASTGNAAGGAAGSGDRPSSRKALRRIVRGHSQRIKGLQEDEDLKKLFWFGRPKIMIRVFRYAYFQSALAIAIVIFGFWQKEQSIFGGAVADYNDTVRAVAWALLVLVFLLLLHTSMYLLPLYALTACTAIFSSQSCVLNYARKAGIRTDLVEFLESTAPRDLDSESEGGDHVPVHNCTGDDDCSPHLPSSPDPGMSIHSTQNSLPTVAETATCLDIAPSPPAGASPGDSPTAAMFATAASELRGAATGAPVGAESSQAGEAVEVFGAASGATRAREDMSALATRAAAEMPISGLDGGGEVSWWEQMEKEQGSFSLDAEAPSTAANTRDAPAAPAASGTPAAETSGPAAAAVSTPAAPNVAEKPEAAGASTHQPTSAARRAHAAAEMPTSGLNGDAAVDWFDRLEKQQGSMDSSKAGKPPAAPSRSTWLPVGGRRQSQPLQSQGSTGSAHVGVRTTGGARSTSRSLDVISNSEERGSKSFAAAMLGPSSSSPAGSGQAAALQRSGNTRRRNVTSAHSQEHSQGHGHTRSQGSGHGNRHEGGHGSGHGGGHGGGHGPTARNPADTVAGLLEAMASQRVQELNARISSNRR